ncbi:hypothetical protein EVC30_007 [Rhizobium phage RHph_Y1_11]|nr:hypothetical protein EVC30_007 [Rhizobium phage RHph_Y1_11]
MANRVVLGAYNGTYAFRVSFPGFNVLDPALTKDQLAFSSETSWATETANILLTGFFLWSGSTYIDVLFGQTFATNKIPMVLFWPFLSSGQVNGSDYIYQESWSDGGVSGTKQFRAFELYTDRARFYKPTNSSYYGASYIIAASGVISA